MITREKLEIFSEYGGLIDGYLIQNRNKIDIFENGEWGLIFSLAQDIHLVSNGLASDAFGKELEVKLNRYCDNDNTISFFKTIHGLIFNRFIA